MPIIPTYIRALAHQASCRVQIAPTVAASYADLGYTVARDLDRLLSDRYLDEDVDVQWRALNSIEGDLLPSRGTS